MTYIKKPKYCRRCYTQLQWCRGIIYPGTIINSSRAGILIKGYYYCTTCKESKVGGTFNIPVLIKREKVNA
jgi:hypothetical protein